MLRSVFRVLRPPVCMAAITRLNDPVVRRNNLLPIPRILGKFDKSLRCPTHGLAIFLHGIRPMPLDTDRSKLRDFLCPRPVKQRAKLSRFLG